MLHTTAHTEIFIKSSVIESVAVLRTGSLSEAVFFLLKRKCWIGGEANTGRPRLNTISHLHFLIFQWDKQQKHNWPVSGRFTFQRSVCAMSIKDELTKSEMCLDREWRWSVRRRQKRKSHRTKNVIFVQCDFECPSDLAR